MISLTGEVALTVDPSVRVMFRCGASAGDISRSISIGVDDIVADGRSCAYSKVEQRKQLESQAENC